LNFLGKKDPLTSPIFGTVKESKIITFKGMPLFQKGTFASPFVLEGELKDVACFFYLGKGMMNSFDSRGKHHVEENNAVLKNCGRYIQEFTNVNKEDDCVAIAVFLYADLLKEIYKDEVPSILKNKKALPKKFVGNSLIEQYMNNLSIYFDEPDTFDEELGILKLKELILILMKSKYFESIKDLLSELFTENNLTIREAVENNLTNNLKIEQLAFICNMSLSTFKREFKKTFNDTPSRYIKSKRLLLAEKRLAFDDARIGDIAFDLGFEDISTFSSNFKEKYGLSPLKYKQALKDKKLNQTRK